MKRVAGKWEKRHQPVELSLPYPVPRAAFGLPIVMHFKDRDDGPADGRIKNEADRFTSPLCFRPIRFSSGGGTVLVVAFAHRPEDKSLKVELDSKREQAENPSLTFKDSNPSATMKGSQLLAAMQDAKGDALNAFCLWLRKEKKYTQLLGGTP